MALSRVSVFEFEKVRKENEKLKEIIFAMIRRYEGRIQKLKDDCEHDFEICDKFRNETSKVGK